MVSEYPEKTFLQMPLAGRHEWSDSFKAETRDVIRRGDILCTRDGQIHVKHAHSGFGTVAVDDLVRGVPKVVDRRTGEETTFADADELVAAGWALD